MLIFIFYCKVRLKAYPYEPISASGSTGVQKQVHSNPAEDHIFCFELAFTLHKWAPEKIHIGLLEKTGTPSQNEKAVEQLHSEQTVKFLL